MKEDRLIVLGVTGGIAAFKAAQLCSMLAREFPVQVVMTENACRFVTPLTFRTLSRRPVVTSLWVDDADWHPRHVELAAETALAVVAPATANCLAKIAGGIADDALSTFLAAYNGPVLLAPAMNPGMWQHPACRENVATLRRRGVNFVGPVSGHVACGPDGEGRMAEPEEIFAAIRKSL